MKFKGIRLAINLFFLLILLGLGLWSAKIYSNAKQVLTFRPLLQEVLVENQLEQEVDENLVLAMIYTESKGRVVDILQASESLSGSPGTITDSRDSLKQGTTFLATNLREAQTSGVDLWTAVQAYNFGTAYIPYVAEHGRLNRVDLAKAYSKEVVAPSLGNSDSRTYRFYHPLSIFYGNPYLYQNGGNYYYAKQVAINLRIIQLVSRLER